MLNEKFFVQVPNMMFSGTESQKVTPNELYLFYFLHTLKTARDYSKVFVNVDLISSQVEFLSRKKNRENKIRIKQTLISLRDKGYLFIQASEDFGYSDALNITLTDFDVETFKASGGYTQVFPQMFELTDNADEFMVLCIIRRYSKIDYHIPYTQFADFMGKSEKHVKSIVKTMEENNLIVVDHGAYYVNSDGERRQETNGYEVTDATNAPVEAAVPFSEEHGTTESRKHNWYDSKARLTQDDFEILLTTKDAKLVANASRRVNAIKAGKGGRQVEKMESDATAAIRRREKQKIAVESRVETVPPWEMDDMDEEYSTRYQRIRDARPNDLSAIVDSESESEEEEFAKLIS